DVAVGGSGDPLAPLEPVLAERVAPIPGVSIPFVGGWVGYLGYEAAGAYERLPTAPPALAGVPVSRFALYRTLTVYDHSRSRLLLTTQVRRTDGDVAG